MIGWLQLTDDQRRITLSQAASESGIPAKAIEKDWWVTLTLKALFNSTHAPHIVFKGGTSLSKCWKLINRFSEDIDIALDPTAFEMEYKEVPTKSYVKRLKKEGCRFTNEVLKPAIEQEFLSLGVQPGALKIEAAPVRDDFPDTDPQTVFVRYRSLYEPISYIPDEVKIEVSVRSLLTPSTSRPVQTLLNEFFPNPAYGEEPFEIIAVEPQKTLLEKIFLLHEEFQKPDKGKIRWKRMSRHLYDLVSLMDTEYGEKALSNYALYDHIINHRKWYTGYSYLDYETLGHSLVKFVPPDELMESYRNDYEMMQAEMIYGETLSFGKLIERLKILQGKIRVKMETHTLEKIIGQAKEHLPEVLQLDPDKIFVEIPVTYSTGQNNTVVYLVHFMQIETEIKFESISVQKTA